MIIYSLVSIDDQSIYLLSNQHHLIIKSELSSRLLVAFSTDFALLSINLYVSVPIATVPFLHFYTNAHYSWRLKKLHWPWWIFHFERIFGHITTSLLHQLCDRTYQWYVLFGEIGDRSTIASCTTRTTWITIIIIRVWLQIPTDSMNIANRRRWHIKVDDQIDVGNVDTATEHLSTD
jgi:hypothetical protein